MGFARVLVPLDGSPPAEQVLSYVVAAEAFGGCVTLVQPTGLAAGARLPGAVTAYLEDRACRLRYQWVSVDTAQPEGEPTAAILRQARESGADLIVLPAPQRLAGTGAPLGAVAEAVVRDAPCPVLLVS